MIQDTDTARRTASDREQPAFGLADGDFPIAHQQPFDRPFGVESIELKTVALIEQEAPALAFRQRPELFCACRSQNLARDARARVKQVEDRDGLILFEIRPPFEIGERLAVARQAQIEIRRDGHHILDRPAPTFLRDGRADVSETAQQKERQYASATSHAGP